MGRKVKGVGVGMWWVDEMVEGGEEGWRCWKGDVVVDEMVEGGKED